MVRYSNKLLEVYVGVLKAEVKLFLLFITVIQLLCSCFLSYKTVFCLCIADVYSNML